MYGAKAAAPPDGVRLCLKRYVLQLLTAAEKSFFPPISEERIFKSNAAEEKTRERKASQNHPPIMPMLNLFYEEFASRIDIESNIDPFTPINDVVEMMVMTMAKTMTQYGIRVMTSRCAVLTIC